MVNEGDCIPEHMKERWQETLDELAVSSQEVNEASARYHRAIMARIAMNEELQAWQLQAQQ